MRVEIDTPQENDVAWEPTSIIMVFALTPELVDRDKNSTCLMFEGIGWLRRPGGGVMLAP